MPIKVGEYEIATTDDIKLQEDLVAIERAFHKHIEGDSSDRKKHSVEWFIGEIDEGLKDINKEKVFDYNEEVIRGDAEEATTAYIEARAAFDSIKYYTDKIETNVKDLKDELSDAVVSFQDLINSIDNIMDEYETVIGVVKELQAKIELLENSPWRRFENYVKGVY